jgi:uncharacterized repeat protein (TIGR02543 family)/LPXTG-motif cell wall-anchored protein
MKVKEKILSLLLAIAMILGMLPMTAMPVYAADATQIKIWDSTEMKTYTLGTDTLPTGLSWNSTDKRLELDGYDGGRIEQATSGDELTFYVLNDSTIDGGEETALRYSNPTIDGVAGKTLTLTGTKSSVMIIASCTIKNITVKVDQAGTVKPNGYTTATSGNIKVRENGRLEVELNKETENPFPAQAVGNLWLYDNGSANITVTANNTSTTDAYGVSSLYLYGTGDCDITVTNNGSGNTWAVQYEPNIYSSYNVTGAWNSPSVSYKAANLDTNADLSALTCDLGAVSPTFKANVTSYTGPDYPYNHTNAGIRADVAVAGASLKINGEAATSGVLKYVPIAVGENVIEIEVTAKDGSTTKTYYLTVNRRNDPNVDTELMNIKVNISTPSTWWENPALTPVYDKATRNYTLNVGTEYNTIYFYLQEMVSGQAMTATVDGASLAVETALNGFQTVQHSFTTATTVFVFTVTSKDGSATDTYTVTVHRGSVATYPVTVNGGSTTTPTPAEGDTVTITADAPAVGKVFDKWTSEDGVTFANANNPTTTFVMPAKAVTVTATYKDKPINALSGTVNITGTLKYGETLTATVTGSNNTGTLSYQWKRGSTNIGTNSGTYTAVVDDIGQTITCEVSSDVETGTISGTTSGVITKADGPAAPTGLAGVKPTTPGGSDGKITGTTALMEYDDNSSFTSPTDCSGTETTGLAAGTYYVRVKETATHEAGAYATVTVPAGDAVTVSSIAVNSTTHKTAYKVGDALDVTNLTIEATMSDSSTQTINVTSGMVSGFDSSAVATSKTLTITYESKTTTYNISIAKADGPAAPTGLAGVKPTTPSGSDGKITGTTAQMEYADNSSFTSPTDCSGTEITGLAAGTYYVRVKATTTHEAGAYATVTVPAGDVATYTVTISGGGTGATGSGSYSAGTTVNIYAGDRSGYTFTGWTSSDVTITNASNKNASFTMPDHDVTVEAIFAEIPAYTITKGANGSWKKGTASGLEITCNGDYSKFTGIKVDGAEVDTTNYTAISGSTVVTLKPSFIETLTLGKHTLELIYTDGSVQTEFTILAAGAPAELPKTGGATTFIWLFGFILSLSGCAALLFLRKLKMERSK